MEKPSVSLVGEDGNVFNVIGRVCKALRKAKMPEQAREFQAKALSSGSYDEVLRLATEYCEVS